MKLCRLNILISKENKKKNLFEIYGNSEIDEFYTDTMLDKPMIDAALKKHISLKGVIRLQGLNDE